jgi:hypothetical protein
MPYTERSRADFDLAFWNIPMNIEIIDKNIFFAGNYRIFQLRYPKFEIDSFQIFSNFKH